MKMAVEHKVVSLATADGNEDVCLTHATTTFDRISP